MSQPRCPVPDELAAYVDVDLSPERRSKVQRHLASCGRCTGHVDALASIVKDLRARVPGAALDPAAHARVVMERIERLPAARPRTPYLAAGTLAALVATLALVFSGQRPASEPDAPAFQARGGPSELTIARDVGLRLYASERALRPLAPGSTVTPATALTASSWNLGRAPRYLLLFAIDARDVVHWISPRFDDPGLDPEALRIEPSQSEQLLPSAVQFEDLAPGPLRLVALIGATPLRVSEIESLSVEARRGAALARRFPERELRELRISVEGARR